MFLKTTLPEISGNKALSRELSEHCGEVTATTWLGDQDLGHWGRLQGSGCGLELPECCWDTAFRRRVRTQRYRLRAELLDRSSAGGTGCAGGQQGGREPALCPSGQQEDQELANR